MFGYDVSFLFFFFKYIEWVESAPKYWKYLAVLEKIMGSFAIIQMYETVAIQFVI